ncbi:pectinesterase family protein [Paenibacillus hamazuiensis]|uniref:pectinesterase family protein n=1 Tax=Paenibacillus hamazuiensis TaxID=2936508 RepID=UPI0020108222|nr:pectinesterase family protein [Paenibacillus hamazuiensis]
MNKALRLGISLLLGIQLIPIGFWTDVSSAAPASEASSAPAQSAPVTESPAGLKAAAGDGQVGLAWEAVPGAAYYNVKRSEVSGGPYTQIAGNVAAAAFTDTQPANGTAYYYVVTAVSGGTESMISNQAKAVPYVQVPGAPEAPAGFSATADDGSVSLTWDPAPGAASYTVKRSEAAGGPYTAVASALSATSYKDTGVINGSTYYYVVTATNGSGEGPASDELAAAPAKVIVVDPNGNGDFTTVQAAVSSVPAGNAARTVIFIREGIYREKVTVAAPLISFVGAGRDKTKIVWNDSNAKMPNQPLNTATVTVNGNRFTASHITFENDAPPSEGQALAAAVNADQAVFENVKMIGYQDTLYAGIALTSPRIGRQYYRHSVIQGRVDYIYGPATAAVFDHVDAVSINTPETGTGGYVTAAATKNTSDAGLVFMNSRLVKNGTTAGQHYLGRPWQDYPTVRYINTWMDDHIAPAGWTTMQVNPYLFAEYNSMGPGASPSTRVLGTQMTAAEASELTVPRIFGGWDPQSQPVILPLASPLIKAEVAPGQPDGVNDTYTKPVVVSLGITHNEYGAYRAEYRVNGGAWTGYAAEFEVSAQGANKVEYRLVDESGRAGTIQTLTVKIDPNAQRKVPAFPGAEGGAMYATGGRGQDVYEVTTLEDYAPSKNEAPIPGSFRDAVSQGNRTIVFRVSGNIGLKERLTIGGKNLTIAGQTAPGDGIALSGYWVNIGSGDSNIIIRHIRFRGGINLLGDTADASGDNIIIDHCSFSWSTDETFSLKEHKNITVQWSIVSDSLNQSIHGKGAHGYGGIWGGTNVTYHHNLIANHASRNPRFDRQVDAVNTPTKIDYRNNVVYNWGFNSAYGGEQATGINMINNYYKPGPSTFDRVKKRLVNPSSQYAGTWYIDGNVIEGYPDVYADNWASAVQPDYGLSSVTRLSRPAALPDADDPIGGPVSTDSAEEAYAKVLAGAGAVLPKRDSLDARIVNDVIHGTGKIVNTIASDGGLPVLNSEPAPQDSDHDGMPDDWEAAHGLNPHDPADRNGDYNGDGYTNLEKYINSLTTSGSANPDVSITNITMHQMFAAGTDIAIEAEASDKDGTVAKVEFYDGSVKLGETASAPHVFTWSGASEGQHYVYAKAIDNTGTMTLSSVKIIHVNGPENVAPWVSEDIGQVRIPGTASLSGTTYKVKGSGSIGSGNKDSFHYVYQPVQGNFEMIANVAFASEIDNGVRVGLMARESLQTDSRAAMIALSEEEEVGVHAQFLNRSVPGGAFTEDAVGSDLIQAPYWFKLVREGSAVTGYVGQDKEHWRKVGSAEVQWPDQMYIGMAVDANKSTSNFDYLTAAAFTDVSLKRGPAFTVTNPPSETVAAPVYTISGHMTDAAVVTVKNNGAVAAGPEYMEAGADFSKTIALAEGENRIEISAQNSDVFGDMVNTRSLTVIYNKQAAIITPVEPVPADVSEPAYTLTASVNKAASVAVKLNGETLWGPGSVQAGEPFSVPLVLREGPNEIEVSAVDEYGIGTVGKYPIRYNKDWGAGLFTVSGMTLSDLNGGAIPGLSGDIDTRAAASFRNNSAVPQSGVLVIALYDGQDRMVRYAMVEQTVPGGAEAAFEGLFNLPANIAGYKLKAFAWNSLAGKQLVSNVVTSP